MVDEIRCVGPLGAWAPAGRLALRRFELAHLSSLPDGQELGHDDLGGPLDRPVVDLGPRAARCAWRDRYLASTSVAVLVAAVLTALAAPQRGAGDTAAPRRPLVRKLGTGDVGGSHPAEAVQVGETVKAAGKAGAERMLEM